MSQNIYMTLMIIDIYLLIGCLLNVLCIHLSDDYRKGIEESLPRAVAMILFWPITWGLAIRFLVKEIKERSKNIDEQ